MHRLCWKYILAMRPPKVAVFLITKHKLHVHLFVILEGWKWSLSGKHRINTRGPTAFPTEIMMRKAKGKGKDDNNTHYLHTSFDIL